MKKQKIILILFQNNFSLEPELNKLSTTWIRERVRQHDIEFDVKDIDKTFSLIGNIWVIVGGYKTVCVYLFICFIFMFIIFIFFLFRTLQLCC